MVGLPLVIWLALNLRSEKIFAEFANEIGEETLALSVTKDEPKGYVKEWKINGENVTLGVERK